MNDLNSRHLLAVDSIQKKLLGKPLTYKEIYNLMDEISNKRLSDVLTTYFVAASFKKGFTEDELYFLTRAMVETGTKLKFDGIVADKHCIGGIAGSRTTMIVVPIIAAAGFKIPKTSSRAITSPAGTADVMETLADVEFTPEQIHRIVDAVGGCIVWGGHLGIAPADDTIIRVEEPLSFESFDKVIISIMSKKVAVSTNHLVLDIPVGPTMKVRSMADAERVAAKFKAIAKRFDIKMVVDINETLEPAGRGIGPKLEARDVLRVLEQHDERSHDLEAKALRLAGLLLGICYKDSQSDKNGEAEAQKILKSGAALSKFKEIIKAQGGDDNVSSASLKPKSHKLEIYSTRSGKIKGINNFHLNSVAKILGAPDDKDAGIYLLKKRNEKAEKGDPLFILYSSNIYRLQEAKVTLSDFQIYET